MTTWAQWHLGTVKEYVTNFSAIKAKQRTKYIRGRGKGFICNQGIKALWQHRIQSLLKIEKKKRILTLNKKKGEICAVHKINWSIIGSLLMCVQVCGHTSLPRSTDLICTYVFTNNQCFILTATDRASYSTLSLGDTGSLKLTYKQINIRKYGRDSLYCFIILLSIELFLFQKYCKKIHNYKDSLSSQSSMLIVIIIIQRVIVIATSIRAIIVIYYHSILR